MVEISDAIRCVISRVKTLKSTNRKTIVFLLLSLNGMHLSFQVRKYFLLEGNGELWHTAATPTAATDYGYLGVIDGVTDGKGIISASKELGLPS